MNLNKLLDKEYESKSLAEILDAPPSALEGLTPKHDEILAGFRIKTIRDLGNWKYAKSAAALAALESAEE